MPKLLMSKVQSANCVIYTHSGMHAHAYTCPRAARGRKNGSFCFSWLNKDTLSTHLLRVHFVLLSPCPSSLPFSSFSPPPPSKGSLEQSPVPLHGPINRFLLSESRWHPIIQRFLSGSLQSITRQALTHGKPPSHSMNTHMKTEVTPQLSCRARAMQSSHLGSGP